MQIGQIYVKKYLSQLLRDSYTYEHKNEILNILICLIFYYSKYKETQTCL